MLSLKEIRELIDLVTERGLASLEIERAGFRLRIEGKRAAVAEPWTASGQAPHGPALRMVPVPAEEPLPAQDENVHVITSPIVGTFYRAANPDAEPFVKVGDVVEKGKTLCIIEAMKLMNEIEADISGTVITIYPQNAQPVEFGETLFALQRR